MNRVGAVAMTAAMGFLSGCATQYWDKDIQYEGVRPSLVQHQTVRVTSTPIAILEVDGVKIGPTPKDVTLDYNVVPVQAARYQYESSLGSAPRQIGQERHDETILQPKQHLLKLEAEGYYPQYKSVSAPVASNALDLALQRVGVVIPQIECVLIVEARREYFEDIEKVIGENAIEHKFERKLEEPEQLQGPNVYRQEYFNLMVQDSVQFDKLVHELQIMAEKRNFVFKPLDAYFRGRFSTNVLDTELKHVVKGQIRPGASLFLVKGDQVTRIANVAKNGDYQFAVRLAPEEKSVFLVSKYERILVVFNQVDVYSQEKEELTEEQFYSAIKQRNPSIDAKVIEALE